MGRRIVTTQLQATDGGAPVDSYFDKVIKYIPADVVGAWVAISGIIKSASEEVSKGTLLWIAFAVGMALTAAWTWKQTQEPDRRTAATQILISTAAFGVWVFALGGPFAELSWYAPVHGSLLLIGFTLFAGLINPPE